jgi:hypothetical protein
LYWHDCIVLYTVLRPYRHSYGNITNAGEGRLQNLGLPSKVWDFLQEGIIYRPHLAVLSEGQPLLITYEDKHGDGENLF